MTMETLGINPTISSTSPSSPIESKLRSTASLHKQLRRLQAHRRKKLSHSWRELSSLIQNFVASQQGNSPATPQPFAILAQLAEQAEELQAIVSNQEQSLEAIRNERDSLLSQLQNATVQNEELAQLLATCEEQLEQGRQELAQTCEEKRTLERTIAEFDANLKKDEGELLSLKEQVHHRDEQIAFLMDEAESLRRANAELKCDDSSGMIADLRAQLLESRKETVELRMQSADLAAQLAKHSVHAQASQEALTWEERKKLLLRELEASSDDSPTAVQERNHMEELIRNTQKEIELRDSEIAELRRMLEVQSSTRDGLAVGAAAIAQLLETDELIQNERAKLKELQQEWEAKVRQAEIELSRERVKLAREKLEVEAWMKTLPKQTESDEPGKMNKGPSGNWLSRLGLKDQ